MFLQNLKLHFLTLALFGVLYPGLIWLIGRTMPHQAEGSPIVVNGRTVGFENIGQSFDSPAYFWSRPSAVGYNAAATGGSNHGPTNPAHLDAVKQRADAFRAAHAGMQQVPADMVTASGGGLDPHISPVAAYAQVARVATQRKLPEATVHTLVDQHVEPPLLGLFGTSRVNVLRLNLALDRVK